MQIDWILKKFEELTPFELYAILQLRNEVFVVEQNCIFQDADDKDQACWHLSGYANQKLVAYSRIVPPGIIYKEASIGRVVNSPSFRKCGLGKLLMEKSIETVHSLYGMVPIKISAQLYLLNFYQSYGFVHWGEPYMEDNILHIQMLRHLIS